MYAGLEQMKPGNTTRDVASKFRFTMMTNTVPSPCSSLHTSIGLSLYEGMWVSRSYSLDHPVEIKQNMTFAVETFAGHPELAQTCRLEEDMVVSVLTVQYCSH